MQLIETQECNHITELLTNSQVDFKIVNYKKNDKLTKNDTRCGGIIFDPTFKYILVILNRLSMEGGDPKWGLPKGHLKANETLYDCATREIKEETGLDMNITRLHSRIKINNTYYYPLIIPFETTLCPQDSTEICDIKWVLITELCNLNTNRELKKLDTVLSKTIKLSKSNSLLRINTSHYMP